MDGISYPKIYLYRRIVQAKLFIDSHYAESINLDNIADEAFFSKYHFIRLFKKSYGKTPHHYLTSVRIHHASLLLQSGKSAIDVCHAVGFESVSSFTGLFKKIVGITPSLYQQRQLQIKTDVQKAPLKFVPNCFAEAKGWTKKSNFQEVIN
ncbi:MAG: helix-turn-helix transcriptional regulator [Cyclobacteriaceae bacterium]|nr:helix-turn-helix transcriptional regulator [Cyclobacteriaceae bacterium]